MMYSNYRLNALLTKTLQFISVTVLKIIFKRHTGKSWTLDAWSGRLESKRLDAWTLQAWTLGPWTYGFYKLGLLDAWKLGL